MRLLALVELAVVPSRLRLQARNDLQGGCILKKQDRNLCIYLKGPAQVCTSDSTVLEGYLAVDLKPVMKPQRMLCIWGIWQFYPRLEFSNRQHQNKSRKMGIGFSRYLISAERVEPSVSRCSIRSIFLLFHNVSRRQRRSVSGDRVPPRVGHYQPVVRTSMDIAARFH